MDATKTKENAESRGEKTRLALIEAGMELFGEYGFNGTSTRMLVDRSGANISAIPYYFESKKGLYHAVVKEILIRISSHLESSKSALEEVLKLGPPDAELALEMMKKMMRTVAKLFVESDEPRVWSQIIMREQANPTDAFDILYENYIKQMQKLLCTLIGSCIGSDPNSEEVKIKSHTLIGQVLVFTVSRESLLRMLGVEHLTEKQSELVYRIILSHVEACLSVKIND